MPSNSLSRTAPAVQADGVAEPSSMLLLGLGGAALMANPRSQTPRHTPGHTVGHKPGQTPDC